MIFPDVYHKHQINIKSIFCIKRTAWVGSKMAYPCGFLWHKLLIVIQIVSVLSLGSFDIIVFPQVTGRTENLNIRCRCRRSAL